MKKIIQSVTLLLIFNSIIYSQNSIHQLKHELKNVSTLEIKMNSNPSFTSGEKSGTLAFFLSLLVPGIGELYLNRYDVGKYFTASEGVLWLSLVGFNYYGSWQRDNYKSFASTYGRVTVDEKDEKYFATIGGYMNINDYNNEKYLYREFDKVYDVPKFYWNWQSNEDRKKYRGMWVSSENSFNNIRFAVALIVVNHIVSAINSAIMASNYNEEINQSPIQINSGVELDQFGDYKYMLNFSTSF